MSDLSAVARRAKAEATSGPSPHVAVLMRATCFLHKRDAQHIGADQHSETANGNGEVDLIHGDPRKTARFNGCDSGEPLLTRSLQSDDPIIMGAPLFAAAK